MKSRKRLVFSWRGMTVQLFGLVILPLSILTIVIAFGGLALHRQAMRTMVGERDERSVLAAASAITEQLNHRVKAVQGLSLSAGSDPTADGLYQVLDEADYLVEDFDFGLAFFARGGEILASKGTTVIWEQLDPADSALAAALNRDAPPSIVVASHPLNGGSIVFVLNAAYKGGPIIVGAFDPASLVQSVLADIFVSDPGSVVFLAASDGKILYQSGTPLAAETAQDHPGIQEALSGNSGTRYVTVTGGEHVVSFSPITPVGWALVIEEPWEAVTPPLLRSTEFAPYVLIPAFILSLVALWFGVRQIVKPLQTLEAQAAELGWGRYEAIEAPVGGIAEIQHLQEELVHLSRKVKASQAGLRGYIGAITTGQEEERRRLARELHDDTLQSLIALNQRIHLARLSIHDPAAAPALDEIQQLTVQTMDNLRRLTRALRPIYLEDLGLVASLETLSREATALSGIPVHFQRSGPVRRLPHQDELALFRIAQEALNNIARHSSAGIAFLKLTYEDGLVRLSIEDDGQGFVPPESPTELAPLGHFGLLGIQERAELIDARLEVVSAPGKGARVTVSYPDGLSRSKR